MDKGDKVLLKCVVKRVEADGYVLVLTDDCVNDDHCLEFFAFTELVTPAPLYENGQEVEWRKGRASEWVKGVYVFPFSEGVSVVFNGMGDSKTFDDPLHYSVLDTNIRPLPSTVTLELPRDLVEALKKEVKMYPSVAPDLANELFKAITNGIQEGDNK